MTKLDLRKELRRYYTAKKRPEMIDVSEGRFLTILGKGDPNGEEYQQAMMALYGISYTLKFYQKEIPESVRQAFTAMEADLFAEVDKAGKEGIVQ